jgi:beta-galactosidase/beta-glucuronidase
MPIQSRLIVRSNSTTFIITVVSLVLNCFYAHSGFSSVRFNHEFAPENGKVAPVEAPFRQVQIPQSFHQNVGPAPDLPKPRADGWDKTPIRIPSPWNVNAFPDRDGIGGDFRAYPSYPKSWEDVQMGWLHRQFFVPASWQGRRLFLHFDAVAGNASVVVNGKIVGSHFDIFLPFNVDVTDAVHYGQPNDLLVGVRKASLFDVQGKYGRRTYQGGSMWGQAIAGIWQDVFLESTPAVHISDVFVKPIVDQNQLIADVTIRNDTDNDQNITLDNVIYPWINKAGGDVISAPEPKWTLGITAVLKSSSVSATVPANGETILALSANVDGRLKYWTPGSPNLYGMVCSVSASGGQPIDVKYTSCMATPGTL